MTLADFLNTIRDRLSYPVKFIEVSQCRETGECLAIVAYAHREYSIFGRPDGYHVVEQNGEVWSKTSYSRWLQCLLNGWKRDESGTMCPPADAWSEVPTIQG